MDIGVQTMKITIQSGEVVEISQDGAVSHGHTIAKRPKPMGKPENIDDAAYLATLGKLRAENNRLEIENTNLKTTNDKFRAEFKAQQEVILEATNKARELHISLHDLGEGINELHEWLGLHTNFASEAVIAKMLDLGLIEDDEPETKDSAWASDR